jgi:hypothetical protein
MHTAHHQQQQQDGHKMTIDEQKEILNAKIERLSFLIAEIEPWKDEAPEGKPSNQSILDNHIIEKNTYIQVLSQL